MTPKNSSYNAIFELLVKLFASKMASKNSIKTYKLMVKELLIFHKLSQFYVHK